MLFFKAIAATFHDCLFICYYLIVELKVDATYGRPFLFLSLEVLPPPPYLTFSTMSLSGEICFKNDPDMI